MTVNKEEEKEGEAVDIDMPADLPMYCVKTLQETSASVFRMWAICLTYLLPNFACGLIMTFSVTGLPFYQSEDSSRKIDGSTRAWIPQLDEDQGSWFVSVISIMMMIGTILGGFLTERIGCLWSIRISVILEICGWVATLWASTFGHLMIGRVLTGLGAGLATPAAYLVLSELSLIRYRGIFATLNSFSNNFAWLIGLVLGRFCSLNTLIYTYALPGVLFLAMSPFLPESPLWLTKRGKDEEAVKALEIIRGREYPVQVEAKELEACVGAETGETQNLAKKVKYYVTAREFIIPMAIMLFLSVIQGSCGVDTISYYSLTIFRLAKISVDEYLMAILLQIGYTAGYLMISPVMEKINRKHLFMSAATFMGVALTVLASYMPSVDTDDDVTNASDTVPNTYVQLILPMAVIMFSLCYGAGFGPAIYTWSSELFQPRARNVGCSLALAMRYIIVALVLKIYPWMLHSVGLSHLFMLHAVVLLIGVLFVFFVMPETRGLSLTELTTLFGGKLPNSETSSESTALTNTTSPQV